MLAEGPEGILIAITHTPAVVPPCGDEGDHRSHTVPTAPMGSGSESSQQLLSFRVCGRISHPMTAAIFQSVIILTILTGAHLHSLPLSHLQSEQNRCQQMNARRLLGK